MKCTKCGEEYNLDEWENGNIKSIMEAEGVCFHCAFWIEKIRLHDNRTFIINGTRYHCAGTCDPKVTGVYKGHGGRKFKIKKNDSDEIYETDNLWCQGDVPEHFKEEIPNNAEFVN